MPLLLGRVRGNSTAGPGGRVPSFPRKRVGGAPGAYERQVRKNRTRSYLYERINDNCELTETENVIFYVSYGVHTEFLRTLLRTTATAMTDYGTLGTRRDITKSSPWFSHYDVFRWLRRGKTLPWQLSSIPKVILVQVFVRFMSISLIALVFVWRGRVQVKLVEQL